MKYRIELTDVQFNAVFRAVNLMMRTGMGQTDDLTEWLVTMGDNIKFDTSTEFEDYYSTREAIRPVIHGVMMGCWRGTNRQKSDTVLELETLYEALRHQEWLDTAERFEADIRSGEPMQWGNEPIPKIEKVEE